MPCKSKNLSSLQHRAHAEQNERLFFLFLEQPPIVPSEISPTKDLINRSQQQQ